MYGFFWEFIPGFDLSEVEKICLESSHAIFGCFPYQLVVVFSTRTVSRSEIFRQRTIVIGVEMFENPYRLKLSCKPTMVDSVVLAFLSSSCDENHPPILWLGVAHFPE